MRKRSDIFTAIVNAELLMWMAEYYTRFKYDDAIDENIDTNDFFSRFIAVHVPCGGACLENLIKRERGLQIRKI